MASTTQLLAQLESQFSLIKRTDHKNNSEICKTNIKTLRSILQQIRDKLNESINNKQSVSPGEEEKLRTLLEGGICYFWCFITAPVFSHHEIRMLPFFVHDFGLTLNNVIPIISALCNLLKIFLVQELEGDLTVQLAKLVSPTSRELSVESVEVLLNNTHITKQPSNPSNNNNTTPQANPQPTSTNQPKDVPTPYPITTSQSSSSSDSPSQTEDVDGPPEIGIVWGYSF